MQPNPSRVADMYLFADDATRKVDSVKSSLAMVAKAVDGWAAQANLMVRLIAAGEARRLGRTGAIRVTSHTFDGKTVRAKIVGTSNDYETRITMFPRAGHHCTCPDWERNGRQVGPCKHVLRLGEFWRDEKIVPELDSIEDALANALF